MLLLVIVAFIATTGFYSAAKQRGLHPGRSAMLPFTALGALLVFAHLTGLLLSNLLVLVGTLPSMGDAIRFVFDVLLLCTYFAFIRKTWIVLSSHPLLVESADDSKIV